MYSLIEEVVKDKSVWDAKEFHTGQELFYSNNLMDSGRAAETMLEIVEM